MNRKEREDPRGAMSPAVGAAFDRAAAKLPQNGGAPRAAARIAKNQLDAIASAGAGLDGGRLALLRALALEALARPHPSGWPELREGELAEMTATAEGERSRLMPALLGAGLVQLRVSGRKRPTVCARLPWLPEPDGGPTTEIGIGPGALDALTAALPKEGA